MGISASEETDSSDDNSDTDMPETVPEVDNSREISNANSLPSTTTSQAAVQPGPSSACDDNNTGMHPALPLYSIARFVSCVM